MGAVFSQAEGFGKLSQLWPAIGFHTVATGLGMFCLGRAGIGLQPGEEPKLARKDPDQALPAARG